MREVKALIRFSIIVPIYNLEKYIEETINSVLSQSYHDFELILVNDGSSDNSKEICEKFQSLDNRIIVLNKLNGGVSDARNFGLDHAKGDYIMFLDGDDLMCENVLEALNNKIEELLPVDLLLGKMDYIHENGEYEKSHLIYPETIDDSDVYDLITDLLNKKIFIWNIFAHVYKRSVIEENHLRFNPEYFYGEDLDFMIKIMEKCSNIKPGDMSTCLYRIHREGSITTDFNAKAMLNQLKIYHWWFNYFKTLENINEQTRHQLCSFIANMNTMKTSNLYRVKDEDFDKVLDAVMKNSSLISYPSSNKNRIISILYKAFGYKYGSRILHQYHRLHK